MAKIKKGLSALKRGFKTLAVKRKGKQAAKMAKKLKKTRGVKRDQILVIKRKILKKKARKLLNK